jgi:hypothetical protein
MARVTDAENLEALISQETECAEPYAKECTKASMDHRALRSIGIMGGEWPTRMSPNISKPNR